jgi:hypothetical protein
MKTQAFEFIATKNDIVSIDSANRMRVVLFGKDVTVTDDDFDWESARLTKCDAKRVKDLAKLGLFGQIERTEAKPEQGAGMPIVRRVALSNDTMRKGRIFGEVNSTIYYHNGLWCSTEGAVVVSDGMTLYKGKTEEQCVAAGETRNTNGVIIPFYLIDCVLANVSKKKRSVVWFGVADRETIYVRGNGVSFEGREIVGAYPAWEAAVPQNCVDVAVLDATEAVLVGAEKGRVAVGEALHNASDLRKIVKALGRTELRLERESLKRPAKVALGAVGEFALIVPVWKGV